MFIVSMYGRLYVLYIRSTKVKINYILGIPPGTCKCRKIKIKVLPAYLSLMEVSQLYLDFLHSLFSSPLNIERVFICYTVSVLYTPSHRIKLRLVPLAWNFALAGAAYSASCGWSWKHGCTAA